MHNYVHTENTISQLPPWFQNPFKLISWLEMERFSASLFCAVTAYLERLKTEARLAQSDSKLQQARIDEIKTVLSDAANVLRSLQLQVTEALAKNIVSEICDRWTPLYMLAKVESVLLSFDSEMGSHLFFWVPAHRASWYDKKADEIVGALCCQRFPSVEREVEEAARCYALDRYTAAVVHLGRASEAGVQAIARAIGFTPSHDNWTLVFRELGTQAALPSAKQPQHWATHGAFLNVVWADLRAIGKGWRNNAAHLIKPNHTEEEAKDLMTAVPMFLRDLATQMDENGTLY